MKFYSNFCLGLARGFRNAPKLYNDDTVRPPEKVTGLASGLKVAGKEFGLGLYDGTSGLFTQPWKGAAKEGGKGFVKGFGMGVGGFFFKNASALCAIPAYTMQGVQAEVRRKFARSSVNYIITSRVLQGEEDWEGSGAEERQDILVRWHTKKEELRRFYLLQTKEREKVKVVEVGGDGNARGEEVESNNGTAEGGGSGRTGRLNLPWTRRRTASSSNIGSPGTVAGTLPPTTASSTSSAFSFEDNESLERAIQQSVLQTSTGDPEEDARVEAAVRASVMEMRRAAELQQQHHQQHFSPGPPFGGWIADQKMGADAGAEWSIEEWTNITDEEYQALIEEAVRRSLLEQELEEQAALQQQQQQQDLQYQYHNHKAAEAGRQQQQPTIRAVAEQHQQQPAIAELPGSFPISPTPTPTPIHNNINGTVPADNDNNGNIQEQEQLLLRHAIEESERSHHTWEEEMARQRTEEEIVLEYVKKQSLAEEEFRLAKAREREATAVKGKAVVSSHRQGEGEGRMGENGEEEEDEELRRAIEESLRVSAGGGGRGGGGSYGAGPSRSR
jgi:hypothetical protein